MIKPYVYIIQNKDQTHWYIGYRHANEYPACMDTDYWGSSRYLKELMAQTGKENWEKTIIKEFDDPNEAHEFEQLMLEFMWTWPGRVNKSKSGYIDYSDPDVKARHRSAMQQMCKTLEHKEKLKVAAQKRLKDPEYRERQRRAIQQVTQGLDWKKKHHDAMQKVSQDPEWKEKQKAGIQRKSKDPEWLSNVCKANQVKSLNTEWREKQKAGIQRIAKPFIATHITTGEEFYCENLSCTQSKILGLHPGSVSSCLNGNRKQHKGFVFRYVLKV